MQITSTIIGYSFNDAPISVSRFNKSANKVLIVAGVHGDLERQSVDIARRLISELQTAPDLPFQLDIIDCLNPDGLELRGEQVNARGIDLNRNYPSKNQILTDQSGKNKGGQAMSEPETQCLYDLVHKENYNLIITLHQKYQLIDYDGPQQQKILELLSQNLLLPVKKLGAYPGSMGSYFGEDLQIPLITIEIPYKQPEKELIRISKGLLQSLSMLVI